MNKNKTKKYYWLASQQLAEGSIVEPGTWHKIVSNTSGHNHALMEEVYERVRSARYPSMPSRQKSMYLFDDKDIAIKFKNDNMWTHTDLYEVEAINSSANKVKLDSDLVIISSGNRLLSTNELVARANGYWASVNTESAKPEVLIESPVKIIRKLPS